LRKAFVLGQKAIARMDGLGATALRHVDDAIGAQIAFGRGGRADAPGFIGQPHVTRLRVGLRIDRDRANAEPATGPHDTARNFAAIGDQNLGEHHVPRLTCGTRQSVSAEWVH
jgi:hypothetical protein